MNAPQPPSEQVREFIRRNSFFILVIVAMGMVITIAATASYRFRQKHMQVTVGCSYFKEEGATAPPPPQMPKGINGPAGPTERKWKPVVPVGRLPDIKETVKERVIDWGR